MLNPFDFTPGEALALGPVALTIAQDDLCNESPWEAWPDGLAPVAFLAGRDGRTDHDIDGDLFDPLGDVSESWAARHRAAIWGILGEALDQTPDALEADARLTARDYGDPLGATRLEAMREALAEADSTSWAGGIAYLEAVAALWRLRGFNADTYARNGYCQGDSLYILVAHPPGFLARVGLAAAKGKRKGHDTRPAEAVAADMAGDADLLAAWAFGDVYGFTLETPAGDHLDSCWGFYGCPWGNNPERGNAWAVLEAAQEALEGLAPDKAQEAAQEAAQARSRFLEARAGLRVAQEALGRPGGALCDLVAESLADLARTWREAKAEARAWRDLAARLAEGVTA